MTNSYKLTVDDIQSLAILRAVILKEFNDVSVRFYRNPGNTCIEIECHEALWIRALNFIKGYEASFD